MKGWWKITGNLSKPNYRPKMEFGISIDKNEAAQINYLFSHIWPKFCFIPVNEVPNDRKPSCKATVMFLPDFVSNYGDLNKQCVNCPYKTIALPDNSNEPHAYYWDYLLDNDHLEHSWTLRLPWRPGTSPDYSDFIDTVKMFLKDTIDNFENKLRVAYERKVGITWVLEGKVDSTTTVQEKQQSDEKIRVVRR